MVKQPDRKPLLEKAFADFGFRSLETLDDHEILYGIYRQLRLLVITTWVLIAVGVVAGLIYAIIIAGAVEDSGGF
jgi:hypothetical protein